MTYYCLATGRWRRAPRPGFCAPALALRVAITLIAIARLPAIWASTDEVGHEVVEIDYPNESTENSTSEKETVFTSWKEMSREENYILFNRWVRSSMSERASNQKTSNIIRTEKRWAVVGLLVLFIPIFSFELFLAISRQILCGNQLTQSGFIEYLCSPHY